MRGALNITCDWTMRNRIIPADAGSTITRGSSAITGLNRTQDHPRGCGEHGYMYRRNESTPWIISADAGSTS